MVTGRAIIPRRVISDMGAVELIIQRAIGTLIFTWAKRSGRINENSMRLRGRLNLSFFVCDHGMYHPSNLPRKEAKGDFINHASELRASTETVIGRIG
jgi:hypothetical protein